MLRSLVALLVAALLSSAVWYWLGRPVAIAEPDVVGTLNCVSYTPYRADQSPFDTGPQAKIDPARVAEDLQLLAAHTSCIRVYATVGMEAIPAVAQRYGLQVVLGAWVGSDTQATRAEVETLVQLAHAYPATIRAVLVGNEVLLRREVSADALAALIREVKSRVVQPVSYADVWEFQLRHPQVAAASDFVTIHILPYWEDQPVAVDAAVAHVRAIRQQVAARFPGKPILIGETGWPSVGRMREGALPSRTNEARFLRGFVAAARAEGWDYNLIEAFDQPWKRRLEGAVGGYWGVFTTGRQDKGLLQGAVSDHPQWMPLALLAAVMALLLAWAGRVPVWGAPLSALLAVGWSAQLEQVWLLARNGVELTAGAALLLLLLAVMLAALARWRQQAWSANIESQLVVVLASVALVLSLWLVFDARYRDFYVAGFLPVVLLLALSWRYAVPVWRGGQEERVLGAWLIPCAVFIAWNETTQNQQALLWAGTMLLLGVILWHRGRQARQPARQANDVPRVRLAGIGPSMVALTAGMLAALAVRYGMLENAAQAQMCASGTGGVCAVRAALGWSLYHQAFGLLALLLGFVAWMPRARRAVWPALLCAGFGLCIYNATYAAIAAVITVLAALRPAAGR